MDFKKKTVPELQFFLKERGISCTNLKKQELVSKCMKAYELNLEIDPDGLRENVNETTKKKLLTCENVLLKSPFECESNNDISILPRLSLYDMFDYLSKCKEIDKNTLRNYLDMEGVQMANERYVLDLSAGSFTEHSNYTFVTSKVKPRTKDRDPITKLQYYKQWIIFTNDENSDTIYSADCNCKGGNDGYCRHVVATLYELITFLNDKSVTSVTSKTCKWVKRPLPNNNETNIPIEDIGIDLQENNSTTRNYPKKSSYNPIIDENSLPSVSSFMEGLHNIYPNACALDAHQTRVKELKKQPIETPKLSTFSPLEKLHQYFESSEMTCETCDSCFDTISKDILSYSDSEIIEIERLTRGQSQNDNWFLMRNGIVTASNIKSVCSSTNMDKTAERFQDDKSFESNLPEPILFGRKYEDAARNKFMKQHKFLHRKCKCRETGLYIDNTMAYIGASPDGIVTCNTCGTFLIEIKCLWKYRNFHPKVALINAGICEKNSELELVVKRNHPHFYQMQAQMAVTKIETCMLVAYTHKGIASVKVDFDDTFWAKCVEKITEFYRFHYIPALKAAFKD